MATVMPSDPLALFGLISFVAVATAILSSSLVSGQAATPQLRLHRGTFDARSTAAVASTVAPLRPAPGASAIIQFDGPITPADRTALERTGVTILEYLPDFAYIVQGTATQLDAAAALPRVYARAPFTLADKLAPALLRAMERAGPVGRVRVTGWPGGAGEMAAGLQALPFAVTESLNREQLLQVARLPAVRWVEPASQPRLLNDYARDIMDVNGVWQNTPLFGSGQTLAIADTGLDTGNQSTLSPDFSGRVVATHALAPGGDWADQHGHGTHVIGSAAGAGVQSGANPSLGDYASSFAGVAPEADLVVQGFEVDAAGQIIGLPADYYQLFAQAYSSGARLHSNSWGDVTGPETDPEAVFGGYPYGAQRTDAFIWDHPEMAIFAAAGNSGADGVPGAFGFCTGGDGVIDPDSLLSPATAKNVITVGAAESNKDEGPLQGAIWLLLSFCFATDPILSDPVADNINGMAAFSSRGPADDGRAKPDITAPGVNIVSNRSHDPAAGTLWGAHPTNPDYVFSGGTSMATPLTAGMGVLAREWLTAQGAPDPSAALVKATLLNTTTDMAPGQYGSGATQEIPFARPNGVVGWGRASLGFLSPQSYYTLWFDDHTAGLGTGDNVSYTHSSTRPLQVTSSTQPLRVMLVWTDPPASLSASTQLVNDLDLVVTGPGGTYHGNGVATGDRRNNVEGVIVDSPPLGTYQVTVSAYNVPVAAQPYALVVAGPLTDTVVPAPTPTHTPTSPASTSTPTPTNTAAPNCGVEFVGDVVEGQDFIWVTGQVGATVTIVDVSDGGQQIGVGTLTGPFGGLACPGLASIAVLPSELVAGHVLAALPSAGSVDTTVVLAAPATGTPTPAPTSSSTPTTTFTPTATPVDTPTSSPAPTASTTATAGPAPTNTYTPTPPATPSHTPAVPPAASATPSPVPTATARPAGTQTPTPSATPTHTITPTAANTATPSPQPTETHTPVACLAGCPTHTPAPPPATAHTPLPRATTPAPEYRIYLPAMFS